MNHSFPSSIDVVICGAGPAGLVAAWRLAEAKVSVLLLDRKDPWKEPVACAEAVHAQALRKWVGEPDAHWLRTSVDGVIFMAPDETPVEYSQLKSGWILDRAKFHKGLADRAIQAGSLFDFRSHVTELVRDGLKWRIRGNRQGQEFSIQCNCFLDCSGPGGKLTKGIDVLASLENGAFDLEPAVFALLKNIPHKTNFIELGFSQKRFPGGYGWVFPRDGQSANVGIVIGKEYLKSYSPRELLLQWIKERWPHAEVGSFQGGAIACGQSRKALACQGVFKAGDSASQVNPISRSGIMEGIKGGTLAAQAIIKWLKADQPAQRTQIEAQLLQDWLKVQGNAHARLAKVKKAFANIPDEVFNQAAQRIQKIPLEKRSLLRIFFSTLIRSPKLLWSMRSLMGF